MLGASVTNPRLNDAYWHRSRHLVITAGDDEKDRGLLNLLKSSSGVKDAHINGSELTINYDLREASLRKINKLLAAHHRIAKKSLIKRALERYSEYRESILRAEQGLDYGWDVWIQDAYVSRYRLRRHGRRDDRITHWRMYERDNESR